MQTKICERITEETCNNLHDQKVINSNYRISWSKLFTGFEMRELDFTSWNNYTRLKVKWARGHFIFEFESNIFHETWNMIVKFYFIKQYIWLKVK